MKKILKLILGISLLIPGLVLATTTASWSQPTGITGSVQVNTIGGIQQGIKPYKYYYPNGADLTGSAVGDGDSIFYANGQKLTNGINLIYPNGSLLSDTAGNLYYPSSDLLGDNTGILYIPQALKDYTVSAGSNGNVLQSTGSQVKWVATSTLGLGTGTVTSVSGSGGTTGLTLTGGPITTSGTLTLGGTLGLANGGTATTTFYNGGVVFSDAAKLTQSATAANFFWDDTNKRLGLGTSTPWGQLSVNPNAIGSGPEFVVGSSTKTDFIITNSGNLGINVNKGVPLGKLDVVGKDGSANNDLFRSYNSSSQFIFVRGNGTQASPTQVNIGDSLGGLLWQGYDVDGSRIAGITIRGFVDDTVDSSIVPSRLSFFTMDNAGSSNENLTIKATGNIGVGTSTPFSRLSVSTPGQQSGSLPLFTVASTTNTTLFQVLGTNEIETGGATPTVSTCGTGSPTAAGNDTSGRVTVGGGVVTACTVTFKAAKSGTPHVFVEVDGATAIAHSVTSSGTSFTVTFGATVGSGTFDYWVVSNN